MLLDITAENLHLLIQQGHARVSKEHQSITHPTSRSPIPAHGEQGQTHFTSLRWSQAHPPEQDVPSHDLPILESPHPLPCPLAPACWELGHSRDQLHFGVFPCPWLTS